MLKNIAIGQYYNADSPVHLLDPRVKVVLTAAFITMVFFVKNYWGYAALLMFVCF